jgi:hypothetical protein
MADSACTTISCSHDLWLTTAAAEDDNAGPAPYRPPIWSRSTTVRRCRQSCRSGAETKARH